MQAVQDALIRALTWAFVGGLFGAIFVVSRALLAELQPPALQQGLAAVIATALGALLYGSMRLTVIVAVCALSTMALAALLAAAPLALPQLLLIGGLSGVLVGGFYGHLDHHSRVRRADAKLLAGLSAGVLGGASVLVPLQLLAVEVPDVLLTALLAPLCGLLYVGMALGFVRRFSHVLAPAGDGVLVGAGAGAVVAVLFWLMRDSMARWPEAALHPVLAGGDGQWLYATASAAAAAALVGVARAILRLRWYNL